MKSEIIQHLRKEICSIEEYSPVFSQQKLTSENNALNQFLKGGFSWGALVELGIPLGKKGREFLPYFISLVSSQISKDQYILWVNSHQNTQAFLPQLYVNGGLHQRVLFSNSSTPLTELRRVFSSKHFSVFILDSPQKLRGSACSFLKHEFRVTKKILFIIRPYFLSNKQGNVWANIRLNCWYDKQEQKFCLQGLRGLSQKKTYFEF